MHRSRRERVARATVTPAGSGTVTAAPGPAAEATDLSDGDRVDRSVVRGKARNTVATAVSSTLAEPAAANEGDSVFYTGNTYASSSDDSGAGWTHVALPAGPPDAPVPCCDQDVTSHSWAGTRCPRTSTPGTSSSAARPTGAAPERKVTAGVARPARSG